MKSSSAFCVLTVIVILLQAGVLHAQRVDSLIGQQINVSKEINIKVAGEPLNYLVNSPFKELGPMPTKDGKRLYFSRQGHPDNVGGEKDEDIWFCEFDEETQQWTDAVNIGPPLNNAGPNFITGVGTNGDTLLLGNTYGKKGKMSAGVSISIRTGETWSPPQSVNIAADYNFAGRTSYDLSADRSALIIAQEKIDSRGKLDLYVAFRTKGKNTYSGTESINLGPVVNTFGNETSPWLSYDNTTLYFSSDGHNGYGKLDIFMAKRLDETWTKWSKPENLGPGVNSSYDDANFNYNPAGRHAYYSRGLTETNSDIFGINMTYFFKGSDMSLRDSTMRSKPIIIGQTYVVKDVFDDNALEIKQAAEKDFRYFLNFLVQHKQYNLLIVAHCSKHESRNESLILSNKRAGEVMDYLVKNGIDKHRLSYQGMGHDVVVNTKDPESRKETANMIEFKFVNFR